MEQESKNGKTKWVLIVVVLLVVVGLIVTWYFLMGPGKETKSSTETTIEQSAPKTPAAGWQAYTSSKYKFTINHPTTYIPETTGDLSIKFKKDGKVVADIFANTGGTSADYDASVKLYTDATKGYMTGGVSTSVSVAGTTGKMISGTFGKSGGLTPGSHEGTTGSVVIFTQDDRTFILESFDGGDATLMTNFNTMIAEMSF